MKPLIILIKIVVIGLLWSVFFVEGIRVIMLENWHFDIFRVSHWEYALNLWKSGWVIQHTKEWAFVLIILTFIPLWLTGWVALSMLSYTKILQKIMYIPNKILGLFFKKPLNYFANKAAVKVVKKKKSYKEVRPRDIHNPNGMPSGVVSRKDVKSTGGNIPPVPSMQPSGISGGKTIIKDEDFEHSLFKFDDDDDDFDFDFENNEKEETKEEAPTRSKPNKEKAKNKDFRDNKDFERSKPAKSKKESQNREPQSKNNSGNGSVLDIIKQKGYYVLSGVTIKNILVDFIGIADNQMCVCMVDKEPGDWLADEERFNDEEPLWFSESSHRISPVSKVKNFKKSLNSKLEEAGFKYEIKGYVVNQMGNIINAEDMFEIWEDNEVEVTRIDKGTPKELKLFVKALEDAEEQASREKLDKIKKLIRG